MGDLPSVILWSNNVVGDLLVYLVSSKHVSLTRVDSFRTLGESLTRISGKRLVLLDANILTQSLELSCDKIFSSSPDSEVIVMVHKQPPVRDATETNLCLSESALKRYGSHVRILEGTDIAREVILRIDRIALSVLSEIGETPHRILPADSHGPKPDLTMPPNELASQIEGELAEFSGSIHLSAELLRDNFIQVDAAFVREDCSSDEDARRWTDYRAWMLSNTNRNYGREVPTPENALIRFGRVAFVPNRFTYLILGNRGGGKSTFLAEFFRNYLPHAFRERSVYAFIVDFLRYDFVRDGKTIASDLQRAIFDERKSQHAPELQMYSDFSTFRASPEYSPRSLLSDVEPQVLRRRYIEFLETFLPALDDESLTSLFSSVTENPLNNTAEAAKKWAHEVLAQPTIEVLCKIIGGLAERSLEDQRREIALQVFLQARSIKSLHPLLCSAGLEPSACPTGQGFADAIRLFLSALAEKADVFLVIDNADRSITPDAERAVFRTAWNFLPNVSNIEKVRLVFAMRQDTFYRNREDLDKYDLPHDMRDIANFHAGIVLLPPSFIDVAKARLGTIKKRLGAKNGNTGVSIIENYVEKVLNAEIVQSLFENLYRGDMRRNLELFEFAVASPHMKHTNAYYFELRKLHGHVAGGDKAPNTGPALLEHRLLTSLMLGPWRVFRQSRSTVFLNVYNSRLRTDPGEVWRNTVALPRLLLFLQSYGQTGATNNAIREFVEGLLGYTQVETDRLISLLVDFRLIDFMRNGQPAPDGTASDDGCGVALTPCGKFYTKDFIWRLEYIQAIYWDIYLPERVYFHRFGTVMKIADLDLFLASFCDFIRFEESREEAFLGATRYEDLRKSLHYISLADNLHKTAGSTVNTVYWRSVR